MTLDYEDAAGTGANVAFDGGQATVITAAGPDGTDTKVLEVVKTDGGKTWAGVKLVVAEAGSNPIADSDGPITMKVYSPLDDGVGSVTIKLEGPNNKSTEKEFGSLDNGWNEISWTPAR